jgi:hypothetical protein
MVRPAALARVSKMAYKVLSGFLMRHAHDLDDEFKAITMASA